MKRLIENLFQRQLEADDNASVAFERMAKEIKGSIFTLVMLFELVALTSYITIDTFNIAQGRLDHINNMGGIVGAVLAHWVLGSVGMAGYVIVLLTGYLAFCAFRGIAFRNTVSKIVGALLATGLASMTLFLCLHERFPEPGLMQGGKLGNIAGTFLKLYLNTTGALLLMAGGFFVTLIITTGFSLTASIASAFQEEESESGQEELTEKTRPVRVAEEKAPEPEAQKAKTKRAPRKKKVVEGETLEENSDSGDVEFDGDAKGKPPDHSFQEMIPYTGAYSLPSGRLLKGDTGSAKKLSRGEIKENSKKLCEHLLSFQVTGEVTDVTQGPVLVTYEFKPTAGVKLSKIAALQEDLGVVLGTSELRIVAPIPGKTVVGIEVPRPSSEVIPLKEIFAQDEFYDKKIKLPVALGKSTDGKPVIGDLAAMPHLLVAGATGSGKSVFMNSLIMSLIFRLSPQQLRLILVDPKMLEFSIFEGIPHLITNVITNNAKAYNALNWAVQEMDRRYALMAETNSKNLDSYNSKQKSASSKFPYIVVIVDELADLMMSGGQAVEVAITRIAQKARAAGIHLVIATQRPSTNVVTGLIKANIPSRLAFRVPSGVDSRTVLDTGGAEGLMGRGDSLMIRPAIPLQRIHGCYVTEDELARVMKYVKAGKDQTKNYIQFPDTMPGE